VRVETRERERDRRLLEIIRERLERIMERELERDGENERMRESVWKLEWVGVFIEKFEMWVKI
jgi:hypothetical protein